MGCGISSGRHQLYIFGKLEAAQSLSRQFVLDFLSNDNRVQKKSVENFLIFVVFSVWLPKVFLSKQNAQGDQTKTNSSLEPYPFIYGCVCVCLCVQHTSFLCIYIYVQHNKI
jgi:hypothetical protein